MPPDGTVTVSEAEVERNMAPRLPLHEGERSEPEMERETGFEPATSTLARSRSTK